MAATARKFEVGSQMPERTVIEEKVDRLREDVTDLKADVRTISASLTEHRLETKDAIAALHNKLNAHLAWTIGTVIAAMGGLFTAARFFAAP